LEILLSFGPDFNPGANGKKGVSTVSTVFVSRAMKKPLKRFRDSPPIEPRDESRGE